MVRVKRNIKQNRNWFYFKFSVESSSFVFNNFRTKNLSLPLKVETDLFVIGQNWLHFILGQRSESCGADAESPFPLFFSFYASFKNSSPREKVGNCLPFGTGGRSLCYYPL